MSDGPHKSLPMRAGWKKFAERADKAAFEPGQVAEAVIPALEDDWRDECAPHLEALRNVLGDTKQLSLLGAANTAELEALKRLNPGKPLWRAVVNGVAQAVVEGHSGADALCAGITGALLDGAARGIRTTEEHYVRSSNETRAQNVRTRMEDGASQAPIEGMARRLSGLDSDAAPNKTPKLQGLDDGVQF